MMRRDLGSPEVLTHTNWKSWRNDIEKRARAEGVWEYCDPDVPEKYYPELDEPEKPHVSTVRPEAKSIVDLGEDDFIELSSVVDQYWKQMRAYEKIQDGLRDIYQLIRCFVDCEYTDIIKNANTPREQLTALSFRFKGSHLENMEPRWGRIQKLASSAEVQELFELWIALFADCDEYVSPNARSDEAFWGCIETAGYNSKKWLPLTSQCWIENPGNVESKSYGHACARCHSPELESITSQHWIQTPDHTESTIDWNCYVQPRSLAKRES